MAREARLDPVAQGRVGGEDEAPVLERERFQRVEPQLGEMVIDDAAQLGADLGPDVGELRVMSRRDRPLRKVGTAMGGGAVDGPRSDAGAPWRDRSIGLWAGGPYPASLPARSEDPRAG
jgi:hypothetical protein